MRLRWAAGRAAPLCLLHRGPSTPFCLVQGPCPGSGSGQGSNPQDTRPGSRWACAPWHCSTKCDCRCHSSHERNRTDGPKTNSASSWAPRASLSDRHNCSRTCDCSRPCGKEPHQHHRRCQGRGARAFIMTLCPSCPSSLSQALLRSPLQFRGPGVVAPIISPGSCNNSSNDNLRNKHRFQL